MHTPEDITPDEKYLFLTGGGNEHAVMVWHMEACTLCGDLSERVHERALTYATHAHVSKRDARRVAQKHFLQKQ